MMQVEAKKSDVIELNVAGRPFATTRATLCAEPDTLLASMFSGRWEGSLVRDRNGVVFIDFNPDHFSLLLDYLRQKNLSPPNTFIPLPVCDSKNKSAFGLMLDYFGFQYRACGVSFSHTNKHAQFAVTQDGKSVTFGGAKVSAAVFAKTEQFCGDTTCTWLIKSPVSSDSVNVGILPENGTKYQDGYTWTPSVCHWWEMCSG
eukprot:GDKI01040809.1.p1 GENE.GDKI01040809.1~~GDKI01040809.1.p1  ORF type:complete len:202 (-),score=48.27 GDKI01040809.1:286-891(-)